MQDLISRLRRLHRAWLQFEAVELLVRAATVMHPRHRLLARVAAFPEADGPLQSVLRLTWEILRCDVSAEAGDAGFDAGGLVGVGACGGRAGFDQVLADRDAYDENRNATDLCPCCLVFGEVRVS